MQAHENHLRKLLESNSQQYIVPLFQRFYVWEKPAWQRLWDDLTELLDDNNSQHTHFLGSIVVIPAPATPNRSSTAISSKRTWAQPALIAFANGPSRRSVYRPRRER